MNVDALTRAKCMTSLEACKSGVLVLLTLISILLPTLTTSSEVSKKAATVRNTDPLSTNRVVIQTTSVLDETLLELLDPTVNEGRKVALLKSPKLTRDDKRNEEWFPVLVNLIDTAKHKGLRYCAMISLRQLDNSKIAGDVARYLLEFGADSTQDQELRRLAIQGLYGFEGQDVSRGLADVALKGSPLFREGDFKDIKSLIIKLREANDPVSRYLWGRFSEPTKQMLKQYNDTLPVDEGTKNALINELNQLLRGETIYNVDNFSQVTLSKQTQKLILFRRHQKRDDLVRLNRYLIEEAYPHEIMGLKSEDQYLRLRAICALQHVDNKLYTAITKEIEMSEPMLFALVQKANQDAKKDVERRTMPKLLTPEEEDDLRAKLESGNEKVSFSAIQTLANGEEANTIETLMQYYASASRKNKGEIALSLAKIAKRQPEQRELIIRFLEHVKNEETDEFLQFAIEKLLTDKNMLGPEGALELGFNEDESK